MTVCAFFMEDFVISDWTLAQCLWSVLDNSERTNPGAAGWDTSVTVCVSDASITLSHWEANLKSACLTEALPLSCSAKSGYFKEEAEWFCLKCTRHLYKGWELRSMAQVLLYGEVLLSLFFQSWKGRRKKCIGAQLCKICGPEWQAKCYAASCGKISAIKSQKSGLWASSSKTCDVLSSYPRKVASTH